VGFTFTVEAGAVVSCALDSTTLAACPGGAASYTNLTGGAHVFRVRAEDDLGNDGPLVTRNFTVDAVGPTVTITPFADNLSDPAGTVAFSANESGSTFECALDTGGFASCPAAGFAFSGLAAGAHTVRVRATDAHQNTGAQATYSWEVLGTVNVVFEFGGVPQVGAAVMSHRGNGAVLRETTTGAGGAATVRVLPGSLVTAAGTLGTIRILYTAVDVQPGDSVRLDIGRALDPAAPAATVILAGDVAAVQRFSHWLAVGAAAAVVGNAAAAAVLTGSYPVYLDSYDLDRRINLLGQASNRDQSAWQFLPITGLNVPPGGSVDVPVPGWVDAVPWDIRVVNISGYRPFTLEPGVYRRGVAYPIAQPYSNGSPDNEERRTFHMPPAGFPEGRWVRLRAHVVPAYKSLVTTNADVLDLEGLLPTITDLTIDNATSPGRPEILWSSDGDLSAVDGAYAQLLFRNGEGPFTFWFVITPPDGRVQLPELPAALASWRPAAGASFSALIQAVDSNAVDGYTAWKSVHQRFIDASSTVPAANNLLAPPYIPVAGTRTRTTMRVDPPPAQ
jgi:hypothetical protein